MPQKICMRLCKKLKILWPRLCQNCLNVPTIEQLSEEDSGEESDNSIELDSSPASEEEDSASVMDEEIITNIDDLFF